jgi:hypothetical protein
MMRTTLHEVSDYPDAGNSEVPCCMGSAVYGPDRCTCWRPVYEPRQEPAKDGPRRIRPTMCADCAFRPDSPERTGDQRYEHSHEEALAELVHGEFVCHQGMRRLAREVHPSGAVAEAMPGAYEPTSYALKADGSPADYCAGWWAAKQRAERESNDTVVGGDNG